MSARGAPIAQAVAVWAPLLPASLCVMFVAVVASAAQFFSGCAVAWAGMLVLALWAARMAREDFGERTLLVSSSLAFGAVLPLAYCAHRVLVPHAVSPAPPAEYQGVGALGAWLAGMTCAPLVAIPLAWRDRPRLAPALLIATAALSIASLTLTAFAAARAIHPASPPSPSAPRAWIALAFAGVVVAAVSVAWGRKRLRSLHDRLSALEAHHIGGGSVRVDQDSPPFTLDAAAGLPVGPVLLVGAAPGSATDYRTSSAPPGVREIVAGTRESARAALASARASWLAFALLGVSLSSAPLAVAAFEHLVF